MKYPAYIIVHTRNGYLAYGPCQQPQQGSDFTFTKDIADAAIFNKFEEVQSLCDRYMACAWVKESGNSRYVACYEPGNQIDWYTINEIKRHYHQK